MTTMRILVIMWTAVIIGFAVWIIGGVYNAWPLPLMSSLVGA